jgi:hypothetical protein
MVKITGKCSLRPGPSAEKPITFVQEGARNEDGEVPRIEMDLSLVDADDLARGLQRAALFVHEGIWKPATPSFLNPLEE